MCPEYGQDTNQPKPCPFCGHVSLLSEPRCPRCKLGLDDKTVRSLGRLMGPWFLLDEANLSAPGVKWEKFLALIEHGKVGPMSIVRGPATGGLWRMARDAPAVATQLGMCWSCHAALADLDVPRCDRCGAATNAPVNWASPPAPVAVAAGGAYAGAEPAGEDHDHNDEALLELVQASAPAGARPGANGIPMARKPESSLGLASVIILSAALVVALAWGGMQLYKEWRWRQADAGRTKLPSPLGQAEGAGRNAGRLPVPDMWPDVPPVRHDSPQPLRTGSPPDGIGGANQVVPPSRADSTGSDSRPPAGLVGTRPAPGSSGPTTATQPTTDSTTQAMERKMLADLLAQAKADRDAGELMKAQLALLEILNKHERGLWPEGAVELLKEVQGRILATSRKDDEPSAQELERQRQEALGQYEKALVLEKRGDYLPAQDLLLKALNEHHPKAWPAGAKEALQRVQKIIDQPTSVPKFFGTEPRK